MECAWVKNQSDSICSLFRHRVIGNRFEVPKGSNVFVNFAWHPVALWVVNSMFPCSNEACSGLKEGCKNTRHGVQVLLIQWVHKFIFGYLV